MSAETILTLAVDLVDDASLEALTTRRHADDLSVTPMAVYWHFED